MEIRLAGIRNNTSADGYGWRTVFFSQGCSHHCLECFNPDTWPFEGGQIFDTDEIIAKFISNNEKDLIDGVTFSGGDPFQQQKPFAHLAKEFKKIGVNIWVYTGYTFEQLLDLSKKDQDIKQMIENIDVIVDGPFVVNLAGGNLKYRGSSNQRIIDVKKSLAKNQIVTINF